MLREHYCLILSAASVLHQYSANASFWEDQSERIMLEFIRLNQTYQVMFCHCLWRHSDSPAQITAVFFPFKFSITFHILSLKLVHVFFFPNISDPVLWPHSTFHISRTFQTPFPPTALSQTNFPSIRKYFCCAPLLSAALWVYESLVVMLYRAALLS